MKFKILLFLMLSTGCSAISQDDKYVQEVKLEKSLKEISGMANDGTHIWAISDDPKRGLFKLDLEGKLLAEYTVSGYKCQDVEAVSVDNSYVYMGDFGDNSGNRGKRNILRIRKASIPETGSVSGDLISFTFKGANDVKKKKENAYDCESMFVYGDSIYLFTKRRTDGQTELCSIPAQPGDYTTNNLGTFDSKGLVTDASISSSGKELALVGYDAGHREPFIWLLNNFKGRDFFSGDAKQYSLSNSKKLDWQVESVTFKNHNNLFIACEGTKDVPQTFYELKPSRLKEK